MNGCVYVKAALAQKEIAKRISLKNEWQQMRLHSQLHKLNKCDFISCVFFPVCMLLLSSLSHLCMIHTIYLVVLDSF